jgi:soluble lytic murein transglycosylase-like protein
MDITPVTTSSVADPQKAKIQKVAQDFEALFTSMMLKSMRKTVGDNPLMPESFGEKIYTEMLDDEYSKMMGKHASLGLADLVVKELERQGSSIPFSSAPNSSTDNLWMLDKAFIPQQSTQKSDTTQDSNISSKVSSWDDLITEASNSHGVDKNLIAAVIAQESGGNPRAVSKAGAKGLMQLMDSTATELGVHNSFSPRSNIMGGTRYLRNMLDKYDGNEQLALASYNAGPSSVDKYKGIPPYSETQNYVKSVLHLKEYFANNQEQ